MNNRLSKASIRIVWSLALMLMTVVGVQAQKQLYIMHSSDTHSRIEPLDNNPSVRNANMGGVTRRASLVDKQRQEHPDLLLFDCGDISQGTPYYNMYGGEVEIKSMNLMGYDAMTIGNHEFDNGMDNMVRLFSMANFDVVCSNYDFSQTALKDLVKPYKVIKRHGVRIGVFGLSPRLVGLVQMAKCQGVKFLDPVQTAREMVRVLRLEKHCDVVICLSHLGVSNVEDGLVYDNKLVPQVSGIDLILGGHTHTFMEKEMRVKDASGKEVPIMHIGNLGVFMSQTVLTLQKK